MKTLKIRPVKLTLLWEMRGCWGGELEYTIEQFGLMMPLFKTPLTITPPSTEEAYVWYSLSARQGDPGSAQRAATLAKNLPDADLRAADARLDKWVVTPSDDSGNVVTVIDPSWNDARSPSGKSSS